VEETVTAFGLIFVAELGDKTQLAAAGFATRHRPRLVALGVVIGYLVVSSLSVAIGTIAGAAFPARAVNVVAGLVFIAIGIATLRSSDTDDAGATTSSTERSALRVVGSVAAAIALAELGDKTMLATISLAAGGTETIAIWVGATAGIIAAGLLGVALGDAVARRVSPATIRLAAGTLFVIIGIVVLAAELR
jgi:putative Ca2+/H+ antiporter (TMEM165/GDT1 family)